MEWPLRHGCTVRAALPSYNLSVCFADSSPSRGASGETVHFAGTAKASPTRGGGSASALTERLSPAAAHGQASLRTTSQSRFVRQGRVAAPSVCCAVACILLAAAPTAPPCFRRWRWSSPLPLVGEPLAKPFTLRGLPKPPLGRGGGSASALTERLSPAAAHGQASILSFPYNHNKKSRNALLQALRLSYASAVEAKITSPCLRLQQRSRQNASPGPRP